MIVYIYIKDANIRFFPKPYKKNFTPSLTFVVLSAFLTLLVAVE